MSEIIIWHPHLPDNPGINKKKTGVELAQKLVCTITKDDPSLRLIGLPSFQLKRISEYAKTSAGLILTEISVSPDEFINHASLFDLDILKKEAVHLHNSEDPYLKSRRINQIIQAILRGELTKSQYQQYLAEDDFHKITMEIQTFHSRNKPFLGLKARQLFEE